MKNKKESGQVIVLLVFAVVGLIGFTALAIDGGTIYSERRQAQSASDASSLAGGGSIAVWLSGHEEIITYKNFDCSSTIVTSGINNGIYQANLRAAGNDYLDEEVDVTAVCVDDGSGFDKKYIDITTRLTTQADTSFLHVVYKGFATNQVESTVRVRPSHLLAFGNAIVALNEDECQGNQNGVVMGGSSGTYIKGGGIYSNGCMVCNGLSGGDDYDGDGVEDPPVLVDPGEIQYVGSLSGCDMADLEPDPVNVPDILPYSSYSYPLPNCNHPAAIEIESIVQTTVLENDKLYCVISSGNALKITNKVLTAERVTLYFVNGGDIEIQGGEVHFSAPLNYPDPSPAISGVLIYVNPYYESNITINGDSNSSYFGTIYAPNASVKINGAGTIDNPTVFHTQIIANNVEMTGNAYINISYENENNAPKPAYIDLIE